MVSHPRAKCLLIFIARIVSWISIFSLLGVRFTEFIPELVAAQVDYKQSRDFINVDASAALTMLFFSFFRIVTAAGDY